MQGVSDLSVRQTEVQRDLRAFLKLLAAMARSGSAEAGPAAETELVQVGRHSTACILLRLHTCTWHGMTMCMVESS